MTQAQGEITISTRGKGLYDVSREISRWIANQNIDGGLITVFLQHTSASLTIQENADPDVLRDITEYFERLVPEGTPWFRHTLEGPDDMPSHIRSTLTSFSLSIPVRKTAARPWDVASRLRFRTSSDTAPTPHPAAPDRRVVTYIRYVYSAIDA
jgi:secondary thiamine-phosphate synthase enzyme